MELADTEPIDEQQLEELLPDSFVYVTRTCDCDHDFIVDVGYHYLAAGADIEQMGQPEVEDNSSNTYVEILFPGETAKLILDSPPPNGTCARLRVYVAGVKRVVIERDADLLTADDYKKYAKEVVAAIYDELKTWLDHSCFERRPRRGATNILDIRWVGKFKFVKAATNPDAKVKIIRMRMTLMGFKDWEAHMLTTYAGTAQRTSQRILTSEAAVRGWPMAAIDVRRAFLKAVSYKELAAATGEQERNVNFELSADIIPILRKLPGYADFDPRTEVLHCTRPGTGTKDAPRAFSIQLARCTNDKFGCRPTTCDPELIVKHEEKELRMVATKHVDDIRATAEMQMLKSFIACLEEYFGKGELEITFNNFSNCGLRYTRLNDGSYTADQEEYLKGLKPISTSELTGAASDAPASPMLSSLFLSLLMALAFTLMTRGDLAIFIIALQRHAQSRR